jgi:DNA-binding GntR family transcriptional regulator
MAIPAYQRIYEDLSARIRSGELAAASQLPGEPDLAGQYGVARMTVRQAISRLVDDSLVVRLQGKGTFVAKDVGTRRSLNRLTSFTEDMREEGRAVSTELLVQKVDEPTPAVAAELELDAHARVVVIGRLRRVASEPVSIHYSYLPYSLFPALEREPLSGGSLYRTLAERHGIRLRRAEQRIRAVAANAEQSALLGVPRRSPLLRLERLTSDVRNVRIEFAQSWARPEFELTVHLER